MREKRLKLNVLFQCALAVALSCCALDSVLARPEAPSIFRTVTEIEGDGTGTPNAGNNAIMARPHIPVNHTTADGRVGLDMKPFNGSGMAEFYLYVPEKVTTPFMDGAPGPDGIMDDEMYEIDYDTFISEILDSGYDDPDTGADLLGEIRHLTIIDKTREFDDGEVQDKNPTQQTYIDPVTLEESYEDVYDLVVYATADWYAGRNNDHPEIWRHLKMQMTPITVYVENPKTTAARIRDIVIDEAGKTASEDFLRITRLFENKFTNDGKLMVARVGLFVPNPDPTYYAPDTGELTSINFMDIVYAYSSDGSLDGKAGDPVDGFDNVIPISYAPYDPRINGTRNGPDDTFYPFAAFPFRDGSGNIIKKGADFGGSYPWVDTDGRTLSMSTVGASLLNVDNAGEPDEEDHADRYPNTLVAGVSEGDFDEDDGPFTNQSIIGLWTQGKLVTIDSSLNNTDYGLRKDPEFHRILTDFYDAAPGAPEESTLAQRNIRIGSGRDNNNAQMFGGAGNTTFFDTIENKFNFNDNLKPVMPRDVVWWLSNGKSTAQFAFDDYLNKDSFIISKMNGALEADLSDHPNDNGSTRFTYYDGWDESAKTFNQPIKLANDATAVGDVVAAAALRIDANTPIVARWNIPENGVVSPTPSATNRDAGPRLEPIAHGGIEGKGMWLDEHMKITYAIPAQPSGVVVSDHSWYVGIFVDSRVEDDDTAERRLITFPDGTYISLVERETLNYRNSSSTLIHTINLTQFDLWSRNQWRHLAFQISAGGQTVEFYHNGMLADIASWTTGALFQMNVGDLIVGATSGTNGYKGWFDDFKVFGQSFGPEVCANLARGTLVAVDPATLVPGLEEHDDARTLVDRAEDYATVVGEDGLGEAIIRNQLYHSGQETHASDYRYAVHYDYTDHDGAHLGNVPTGAIGIRDDIIFPEAPLFYNVHRPDSIDKTLVNGVDAVNGAFSNAFCLSCHDNSNPASGMKLAALELNANLLATGDPRRQPVQALRRVFGHIPQDWIGTHSALDAGASGILIDQYILESQGAGSRTVHTLSLLDQNDDIVEGLESGDRFFDDFGYLYQVRANLDAAQGSVKFTFTDENDPTNETVIEVDEAPYTADLPGVGTYTIVAEPFTFFQGSGNTVTGQARTVTGVERTGVPIGRIIALKSADEGYYVNVDSTQGNRIEANVATPPDGSGQHFEVVALGNDIVALKSVLNGNFLEVNTSVTPRIINASLDSTVDPVPATAQFDWIAVDQNTVRLRNMSEQNDVDHIGADDVLRARFQNETSTSYRWDWELID